MLCGKISNILIGLCDLPSFKFSCFSADLDPPAVTNRPGSFGLPKREALNRGPGAANPPECFDHALRSRKIFICAAAPRSQYFFDLCAIVTAQSESSARSAWQKKYAGGRRTTDQRSENTLLAQSSSFPAPALRPARVSTSSSTSSSIMIGAFG